MTARAHLHAAASMFRMGAVALARHHVDAARALTPRSAALAGYWQAIATPDQAAAARSCEALATRL